MADNVWIIFIGINCANAWAVARRASRVTFENPESKVGYGSILRWLVVFENVPWLLMGALQLTGTSAGIRDYLHPLSLNPSILVWHFTVTLVWLYSVGWFFWADGVGLLSRHPGLITVRQNRGSSRDPTRGELIAFGSAMIVGRTLLLALVWLADAFPY